MTSESKLELSNLCSSFKNEKDVLNSTKEWLKETNLYQSIKPHFDKFMSKIECKKDKDDDIFIEKVELPFCYTTAESRKKKLLSESLDEDEQNHNLQVTLVYQRWYDDSSD